jgi:hypothetical protein
MYLVIKMESHIAKTNGSSQHIDAAILTNGLSTPDCDITSFLEICWFGRILNTVENKISNMLYNIQFTNITE